MARFVDRFLARFVNRFVARLVYGGGRVGTFARYATGGISAATVI